MVMGLLDKLRPRAKEPDEPVLDCWTETWDTVARICRFDEFGNLSVRFCFILFASSFSSAIVKVIDDSRPIAHRMVESFMNKFFPSGYPYSVGEGYLTYSKFRAMQHFSSAALSVLSTQNSTAAQYSYSYAVIIVCCRIATDSCAGHSSELADILYDLGTGLEGMAVVAARATRLPIYSSFAKENNLSDLFAKGEAISTLFNVVGMGVGIQLASTICASMQGKLVVAPLLSIVHIYSVTEEMRAAPVNTLNPQRTAMIVEKFIKTGHVSSPAELRYRESLLFPDRLIKEAGNVKVGRRLREVVRMPSRLSKVKEMFPMEKFLLVCGNKWTDMILEHGATGEDALRGWLVAAYATGRDNLEGRASMETLSEAHAKMNHVFPSFIAEVQKRGWHTDQFLDGTGSRFAWRSPTVSGAVASSSG
ncbi:root UVB sensitive 2 protein [Nymphaea thermarum]|nr:root UVB sensitive 2 protein [Nymphaea thermarum]